MQSTTAAIKQDEKDHRLENMSWRVWAMKRKRATTGILLERERIQMLEDEEEEESDLAALSTMSLADLSKIAPDAIGQSFSQRTSTSQCT